MFRRRSGVSRAALHPSSSSLHLEILEARQLLAIDLGIPMDAAPVDQIVPISDPFARDAVTFEQMARRAAKHTYVPGELLVAIESPANVQGRSADLLDLSADLGDFEVDPIKTILSFDNTETTTFSLVHLNLGPGADVVKAMQSIDTNDRVLWSSPNFVFEGDDPRDLIPNDPRFEDQYHHPLIGNIEAWDISVGSSDIVIGITDDGVDLQHEDLQQAIWVNSGEEAGNGIDDDGNGYIDDVNGYNFLNNNNNPDALGGDDHGTHVAGISAAGLDNDIGTAGTAGGATILPLKWYDGGTWTAAIIAETFTYAADNGADIVNTSYNMDGWASDPVVHAAFDYMYDAGVLHFNSAGNGSSANPARQAFEQTLLVVSTESNDTKSGFSNWGTGVDISAPGGGILSTTPNNTYSTFSGTSMAAPNAAGVAALIWSAHPDWTREQVVARLQGTADNIDSLNPAYAGLLGAGRVNSGRALDPAVTIVAPTVAKVDGVPPGGSASAANPITEFNIDFDQLMDATSVLDPANYELRDAGEDGIFDTKDDDLVGLNLETTEYLVGSDGIELSIEGGALGIGTYRLSVLSGGTENPFGTPLDGNNDGIGGDAYETFFSVGIEPFVTAGLPGGLGSASTGNPGTLSDAADSDRYPFFVEAGESVTAVIRTSDPSVKLTAEFVGLGGSVTAANPGDDLLVPLTSVASTGSVMLDVSGDNAAGYQFDIYRNVNVEALMEAADPVDINDSFLQLGSGRYAAFGQSTGSDGGVQFFQSSDPGAFVDISSTGTALGLSDDGEATISTTVGNSIFPSGSVTVGNNGVIVAGGGASIDYNNGGIPASGFQTALLPFWDDIDADSGDVYWEERLVDGIDTLIVQWHDRPHYSNIGAATFQLQLFGSGPVLARYAYEDVDFGDPAYNGGASASIGYQSSSTSGMQFSLNSAVIANGDVVDILALDPTTDVDEFKLELNANDQIDVIVAGLVQAASSETIDLLNSQGNVLATATNMQLGNSIQNFDQGILGYEVPTTDTYTIRVSSDRIIDYTVMVTEDLVYDTEANGAIDSATRSLDGLSGALGHISGGTLSVNQFNDAGAFVDISTTGTALNLTDDSEATITTSVGNDMFPAGSVTVANNGGIIAAAGEDLSTGNSALPSSAWNTALLPLWDDIDADTGNVYWEERLVGGINTLIVQWHDRPRFSNIGDATFQVQVFESGPVPVRFAYQDVDFGDPSFDGGASATIGVQVDPSTFVNVSVNTAAVVADDVIDFTQNEFDMYPLTLADNETVDLATLTPLDDPNNVPGNTLDPGIIVFDDEGMQLAADSDSADGKNASLQFTAPFAGVYYVALVNEGGAGDYVLTVNADTVVDGDFDNDGDYDCDDIDALIGEITSDATFDDLAFDLTGDGRVDLADRDAWLAEAASANGFASPYLLGDANLDGVVDGEDFLVWNANKFTSVAEWCKGDFSADARVDGVDFLLWNANKFQSSNVVVAKVADDASLASRREEIGRSDLFAPETRLTVPAFQTPTGVRISATDSTFASYGRPDPEDERSARDLEVKFDTMA